MKYVLDDWGYVKKIFKSTKMKVIVRITLSLLFLVFITCECSSADLFGNVGKFVLLREKFPSNPVLLLKSGELFFPGGIWWGTKKIDAAQVYDIKTHKFKKVGAMNIPRQNYVSIVLNDGRVLIASGDMLDKRGLNGNCTPKSEIYNPITKTFSEISDMNYSRAFGTYYTLLRDGRVFIISPDLPVEIFNPFENKFSIVGNIRKRALRSYGPEYPAPIVEYSTLNKFGVAKPILLKDGRVLLVGNSFEDGNAEIFDPKTNSFVPSGQMKYHRSQFTATLLADGRVLIVGGVNKYMQYGIGEAEIFDPKTDSFTTTGSLKHSRYNHSAILLSNGKVLIVNGSYGHSTDLKYLKEAELFDQATGQFKKIGTTHKTRVYPDLINISKNQVFILSGKDAEIYKY